MEFPKDRKVIDPAYVPVLCEELHRKGAMIVFTNGVFDLLHPGHVQYLTEARSYGTDLIVALNTDDSVRRIKGKMRPVMQLNDRVEVLAAVEPVSFVTWFGEDTPEQIIRLIRPNVLVKGGDWSLDAIVGKGFVESIGGKVLSIPFRSDYSTTSLMEKIARL